VVEDFERCYGAVSARDARFDGWFVVAVTSTGIYCRPSCPARTPRREHVRFLPGPAAAQRSGFRACKRCRPDASPGSPAWNVRQDVVARAMRLIAEGLVDLEGVGGLGRRLGYSPRQLTRLLNAELGAGPLALARAQRAQTARILIETSALDLSSVAFASGFASVRQFNDTVREVFAATPTGLRRRSRHRQAGLADTIDLRLAVRLPHDAASTLSFLSARAVLGMEETGPGRYARTLALPHGTGLAELAPADGHVRARLHLEDLRDLQGAVQRCRRLLDLDADPVAVAERLGVDATLGPLVRAAPGRRIPGSVDPHELAVRAVVGQQVSVAGARSLLARIVAEHGKPLTPSRSPGSAGLTRLFPDAATLASLDPSSLPMPRARARALVAVADALAGGSVVLDAGADAEAARAGLRSLPGIGAWTADYVAMRAFGHPDVMLAGDLGVRRSLAALGHGSSVREVAALAERWRPWRSYAVLHLWSAPGVAPPRTGGSPDER